MGIKKHNTQADGSIVASKRRYLICYQYENRHGESVLLPISPVQFFSDPPECNTDLTSDTPIPPQEKSVTPNPKDSQTLNGR